MKSAQEKRRTEIESEEKVNRKLLLANASCCYLSRKHATFGQDSIHHVWRSVYTSWRVNTSTIRATSTTVVLVRAFRTASTTSTAGTISTSGTSSTSRNQTYYYWWWYHPPPFTASPGLSTGPAVSCGSAAGGTTHSDAEVPEPPEAVSGGS